MKITIGFGAFAVVYLNLAWWDRYSISHVERFESADAAIKAAFQTISDDRDNECKSYDCIRIFDRRDNTLVREWAWCCDDAGYDWHQI